LDSAGVILEEDRVRSNAYKFTGKERDPESGLDNFGARYYASNLGRFMSPDWDAKPVTVPYASFGDPQTLNLYSYVENAPLNKVDADGHAAIPRGVENNWTRLGCDAGWTLTCLQDWHDENIGSGSLDGQDDEAAYDARVQAAFAQRLAWSTLSATQQGLVSGGEKAWNAMSADAQDNFAAITNALGQIKLSGGATGLSEVQSASMRDDGREMNVVWKAGAAAALKSKGGFSDVSLLVVTHPGTQVLRKGVGALGQGMELIFPTKDNPESQAHIDYNPLIGCCHFKADNDDVAEHKDVYKKFYGPLPGLIP
jgi:RHS repeat-associated protein